MYNTHVDQETEPGPAISAQELFDRGGTEGIGAPPDWLSGNMEYVAFSPEVIHDVAQNIPVIYCILFVLSDEVQASAQMAGSKYYIIFYYNYQARVERWLFTN